jgi:hypothetical protein
MPWHLLK